MYWAFWKGKDQFFFTFSWGSTTRCCSIPVWCLSKKYFCVQIEKQEFGLKPMNCPGHCLMFEHRVRSYRGIHLIKLGYCLICNLPESIMWLRFIFGLLCLLVCRKQMTSSLQTSTETFFVPLTCLYLFCSSFSSWANLWFFTSVLLSQNFLVDIQSFLCALLILGCCTEMRPVVHSPDWPVSGDSSRYCGLYDVGSVLDSVFFISSKFTRDQEQKVTVCSAFKSPL